MDRDRRFEERRYASVQYLPNELDAYASDFDDNGRWVNAPGYGYVWTPRVSVSVGWSPYRNGRWCWIGGDYVWVGYEPWGWAPYHYGRWAYSNSIGWFWVPPVRGAVYWGPGFVGWVSTPTYVAWVPLAPGEIYYGHGYYGPHSVNVTQVNVNKVVVKNVYKNVHVNNGVTVVHHDTFVRGKHVDYRGDKNPFLKEKVHIGRPNIKPERETRMAVVRDIPREKHPPQRIREVKVKELREKRPLVKEKNRSVFSPSEPEKRMKVKTLDTPQERKRFREEDRERTREEERRGAPEGKPRQDDGKGRPAEKQQPVEKEKRLDPAERQRQEDKDSRVLERREMQREKIDQDKGSNGRPPADRSPQRDQRPDQKEMRPDRQQPPQQKDKDIERQPQKKEPVQDRQMPQRRDQRPDQKEMRPDWQQPPQQKDKDIERQPQKKEPVQNRQMQQENQRSRNGEPAPQKQSPQEKKKNGADQKKEDQKEEGRPRGNGGPGGSDVR
jgi:hypothetical protein